MVKMVAGIPHVYRVEQNYYFRIKTPKRLKDKYNAPQIKKSLYTSNLQIANYRATIFRRLVLLLFKQLEEDMISAEELKKVLNTQMEDINHKGVEFGFVEDSTEEQLDNLFTEIPPAGERLPYLYKMREESTDRNVSDKLDILIAMAEKQEHLQKNESKRSDKQNTVPIAQMAEEYINEKRRLKKWADSTERSEVAAVNLIVEYFYPETDIYQISRPQLVEFSNLLHKMPKHRNKRPEFAGMHIKEIFKLECTDTISLKTQQNIMQYICTFFKWCSASHHKNPISNIAEGINIPDDPHTSPNQYKDNFDISELANMLTALAQLKTNSKRWEWQYWIPIVALFSGCRINELCQIYLSDIIQKDGIACFDINPFSKYGDKTVKNRASIRLVPIHSILLELNFLDFVANIKSQTVERLFPDLTYEEGQGYKRKIGRWFNESFKQKYMSTSSRKTFHSIRANFLTQLNNSNPNHVYMQCIAGHARTNITDAVYVSPTIKQLQETIELLDYEIDIFSILGKTAIPADVIIEQIKQLPVQNHYKGVPQPPVKE